MTAAAGSVGRARRAHATRAPRRAQAARAVRRTAWPCSQCLTISLATGALAAQRGRARRRAAGGARRRGGRARRSAACARSRRSGSVGLERAEAAAQQEALELLDVAVVRDAIDAVGFRRRRRGSCLGSPPSGVFGPSAGGGCVATGRLQERREASPRLRPAGGFAREFDTVFRTGARLDRLVMIATSFPRRGSRPFGSDPQQRGRSRSWTHLLREPSSAPGRSVASSCGYTLTLDASDVLSRLPRLRRHEFVRASLFSTERIPTDDGATDARQQRR